MNRVELAKVLGVSARTITEWLAQGMPATDRGSAGRGKAAEFDVAAVRAWCASRGRQLGAAMDGQPMSGIESARTRRELAEASMAEIRLAREAGDLVDAHVVRRLLAATGAQMGLMLERVPDRIAPRLVAGGKEADIHRMLEEEMDQIRKELAAIRL